MSSQAQIEANRRNAQKSTGPITPEGKAVCSLNALKSGIYAFSHIIHGEDPDALKALTAAFLEEHHPTGPTQLALVDSLIATEWNQRRLRRLEAELWDDQIESLDQKLTRAEFTNPNFRHRAPLAKCYQNALAALSLVERRIEAGNRIFLRTLHALQGLQKASVGQSGQPAAPSPKQPPGEEPQPLTPPIGSVPSFTAPPAEGRGEAVKPKPRSQHRAAPGSPSSTFSSAVLRLCVKKGIPHSHPPLNADKSVVIQMLS